MSRPAIWMVVAPDFRTAIQRSGISRACGAWRQAESLPSVTTVTAGYIGAGLSGWSGAVDVVGRALIGCSTRAIHAARAAPNRSASWRHAVARAVALLPARQFCSQ